MILPPAIFAGLAAAFYIGLQRDDPDQLPSALAGKDHDVADFRQADATGKSFETRYYSADIHKAALVLPPFMEQALS